MSKTSFLSDCTNSILLFGARCVSFCIHSNYRSDLQRRLGTHVTRAMNALNTHARSTAHTLNENGKMALLRAYLKCKKKTKGDIHVIDEIQRQLLFRACCKGNVDKVNAIKGVDINAIDDKSGRTPLHIACHQGNTKMTELLLDKGANINAIDYLGSTPLHIACHKSRTAIVKSLLAAGANVSVINNAQRSPLHIVCNNLFKKHRSIPNLIERDYEIIQLLLEQCPDVNDIHTQMLLQIDSFPAQIKFALINNVLLKNPSFDKPASINKSQPLSNYWDSCQVNIHDLYRLNPIERAEATSSRE